MDKKLTKKEKGITLVALIITIIILLILAVVSIRAITGDNILGKSETAKEKYTNSKEIEEKKLADFEESIDNETKGNEEEWMYYYIPDFDFEGVVKPAVYALKIGKDNLAKGQSYIFDGEKYVTESGEIALMEKVLEEDINIYNIIVISKGTKVLVSNENIDSDGCIIINEDNLYISDDGSSKKFTRTELNDEIRNIINSAVPLTEF